MLQGIFMTNVVKFGLRIIYDPCVVHYQSYLSNPSKEALVIVIRTLWPTPAETARIRTTTF